MTSTKLKTQCKALESFKISMSKESSKLLKSRITHKSKRLILNESFSIKEKFLLRMRIKTLADKIQLEKKEQI